MMMGMGGALAGNTQPIGYGHAQWSKQLPTLTVRVMGRRCTVHRNRDPQALKETPQK